MSEPVFDVKIFEKYWRVKTEGIARGDLSLTKSDLLSIAGSLEIENFLPQFLPGASTISGTVTQRRDTIFTLAQEIWGITPEGWLAKESAWLERARAKSGSAETGGKDKLEDVVSAELLVRLVAAAGLIKRNSADTLLVEETLTAINLTLSEVCAKGRTRLEKDCGQTVYKILKDNGLMIGTGAGKYLPDPVENLFEIFSLLHATQINPAVYGD